MTGRASRHYILFKKDNAILEREFLSMADICWYIFTQKSCRLNYNTDWLKGLKTPDSPSVQHILSMPNTESLSFSSGCGIKCQNEQLGESQRGSILSVCSKTQLVTLSTWFEDYFFEHFHTSVSCQQAVALHLNITSLSSYSATGDSSGGSVG